MSPPVVQLHDIGKCYRLRSTATPAYRRLSDDLVTLAQSPLRLLKKHPRTPTADTPSTDFWALKNVSFELHTGEVLGIIGHNGAGKSTLLKILSRITAPTTGHLTLHGRVASLLEVGTGFHPELTGRENIFLNGAVLGMTRREIRSKFDEIVDFAAVERFLDTPVKRYSTGMAVRLAFAVAAHLEPEILIIDEVLAVGDTAFQQKCLGRMKTVAREGRTLLFVSHNLAAVRSLCTRALVLAQGSVIADAAPDEAIRHYAAQSADPSQQEWQRPLGQTIPPLCFEHVALHLSAPHSLHCRLSLRSTSAAHPALIALDIADAAGTPLMQAMPWQTPLTPTGAGQHQIDLTITLPPLVPGRYTVGVWAGPTFTETYEHLDQVVGFEIIHPPQPGRVHPYTPDHGFLAPPCQAVSQFVPHAA